MTAAPISSRPRIPGAGQFAADPRRRAMLGKIHVAKKQLKLPQDQYEAIILRLTDGATASAGDLAEAQMDALLAEFERLGFRPLPPKGPKGKGRPASAAADHPVARKARAMWISLWNLGAVSSATESALEAFAQRQLGMERLQWADQAKGYKLIEALKAMAERHGWSQGPILGGAPADTDTLLQRLIRRQCAILREKGDDRHADDIVGGYLYGRVARWTLLGTSCLQQISMDLGKAVREAQAR